MMEAEFSSPGSYEPLGPGVMSKGAIEEMDEEGPPGPHSRYGDDPPPDEAEQEEDYEMESPEPHSRYGTEEAALIAENDGLSHEEALAIGEANNYQTAKGEAMDFSADFQGGVKKRGGKGGSQMQEEIVSSGAGDGTIIKADLPRAT